METAALVLVFGSYFGLVALDLVRPARRFPQVRGWRLKGLAFFVLYYALAFTLPGFWDAWLGQHRLIDATGLGTWGGALAGFLALELGIYTWHRTMHNVPVLWRWFHQMHHSAERVDMFGAFYFHPLDIVAFTFVGSFMLVMVCGITPEAALLANAAATVCANLGHANLRTPSWLGYIVQRPENHALHHERGVHAYNYGDIALWDMVFGTWKNPATWEGAAGFYEGASEKLVPMLFGVDISSGVTTPAEPQAAE